MAQPWQVQTLLGTRLANRVLEPLWNSAHIGEIEIIWEDSLALEGRAGYYDGVGALKDMIQNHLLQILCLVAMEPPVSMGERDLRDRKVDVLRFGLEPEDLTLELMGAGPHAAFSLAPLTLRARHDPAELPAYGQLLLDVLNGATALSIRADEAEESWRVLTPVLDAWAKDAVPLEGYPAGSGGPARERPIPGGTE